MKFPSHAQLRELLEAYGIRWESFSALRPDSYLQCLAFHSLEHLELVLELVSRPGLSLDEARAQCPPWPPNTRFEGKLPGRTVLSDIGTMLRTDQTLAGLQEVGEFVARFRDKSAAIQGSKPSEMLDTICTVLGEELLQNKLQGLPIAGQLKQANILLKKEKLAQDSRRIAILEKKAAQLDAVQLVVADSLSPEEKQEKIRGIFGMA